jgi:Ferritin-like
VYLLGQACELEHGLMCEYLYTQFSLKRGLEGRTVAQLDGVKAWETALISVTKQEMLHLALSTNILTAGFAAARHAQPLTVGDSGLVGVPQERRTVPQST